MTLAEFRAVTADRIPSPAEFVAFADGQGWRFGTAGGKPVLYARRDDPLAVAFARMLSREPYRTNVLAILDARGAAPVRNSNPEPAPEPEPEADVEVCRVCGREVADEDKPRLADPLFCERGGGGKACVDGNGVAHPEALRCPYKPT